MNIDLIIVIAFLTINLSVGLYYGRGIKTIKEYAIGDRNFSTATIAATIIATWISGSDFAVGISETYSEGIWYLVAGAGDIFALLIIGYIFGPRMKEFFGSLSVAESMGTLYGKKVRIITAVCAIAHGTGQIALQIKIFSTIFSHFLKFSSVTATLVSSFIVIIYSAWGGIKAVTFTDVIQFFTFGIFIPMFAVFIWQIFGDFEIISAATQDNPLFDFKQLFDPTGEKFWPYFFLLLYFSIPSLNSTMFQRTLMARNTDQIKRSFSIAAFVALLVHLFACFIGLITLAHNSTLDSNNVVMHIIDNYSFVGLKGITLIGIMAMIMSTADSWINTSSVIFSHDLCKPLGIEARNELFVSRIFSIFIGICAVFLALSATSLLKLLLLSANFYKPIITVPLILAILGFRSSTKAVLIGMISVGGSAFVWKTFITPKTGVDSVVPAMAMNLVAFIGSHYLLKQSGGWINRNEDLERKEIRRKKKVETEL